MNYVIYGAGYRGKRLLNYIGAKKVCAFIDVDTEKQGKPYCGVPADQDGACPGGQWGSRGV